MQKTILQNLLARNQSLKRARRKDLQKLKEEWRTYDQQTVLINRKQRENVKMERKNRREDWMLGPLAPNRNVGRDRAIYGTVHVATINRPEFPERFQKKDEQINIVAGDRVCVVSGKDKGKIGKVEKVEAARGVITVAGINMTDIAIPPWVPPDQRPKGEETFSAAGAIPINTVRLVYKMAMEDGTESDCIVRHLRGGSPKIEQPYGSSLPSHTRYVAGTEIAIPWPDDENPKEFNREEADTPRLAVEEVTYMPSVIDAPIPAGSIDELRPRHERGRGRFDYSYVGQKVLQDLRDTWEKTRLLVSPEQELAEQKRMERERERQRQLIEGPPRLSKETLDLISEMQATTLAEKSQRQIKLKGLSPTLEKSSTLSL